MKPDCLVSAKQHNISRTLTRGVCTVAYCSGVALRLEQSAIIKGQLLC